LAGTISANLAESYEKKERKAREKRDQKKEQQAKRRQRTTPNKPQQIQNQPIWEHEEFNDRTEPQLSYASNSQHQTFDALNIRDVKQTTKQPSDKEKSKKSRKHKKKKKKRYSSSSSNSSSEPYSDSSSSDPGTSYTSGSSNPSESTTPSEKSRRQHQCRHSKKKRDSDKPKLEKPPIYDGKADLDTFDRWAFKVSNYAKGMRLSNKSMIRLVADLVTGKATDFYMIYVADCQREWTLARLIPALFDYCFPNDIMQKLRRRWDNIVQGKTRVQEYARDVEKLARRFKEVNERTVVLTFWKGLNAEIRKHMVLLGANPETDSIGVMINLAVVSEKALDQLDRITKNDQGRQSTEEKHRPKREWTRFKNRTGGNKHYKPGDRENQNAPDKVRANAVSPQNSNQRPFEQRPRAGPSQQKLSRAKLDELRAEGKCFNCKEKGHEQRNCPKLNSLRPPRSAIKTGSISFAKMEKLADRKEKADLYSGYIAVIEPDTGGKGALTWGAH